MMDERKDARTDARTDGRTWATLNALPHSTNSGGIKIKHVHQTCNKDHGKQGEQLLKSGDHSARLNQTNKMQRAM